ncbi:MAG TPA: NADH-quinone oxidoreductase subunit K [Kiritimatiellia bacterium]|nr:NADH-quinone oxidoreductase subunit K [Kiritimatiellia bacterium]
MNITHLYGLAGVLLLAIGMYGVLIQPHLLKKLLSLNIASGGVFLLMVALAFRGESPDPVPHALVLTGIVISVSATAYAVALAARIYRATGRASLDQTGGDRS